jgi:glucose/arabinose dehydrogenase
MVTKYKNLLLILYTKKIHMRLIPTLITCSLFLAAVSCSENNTSDKQTKPTNGRATDTVNGTAGTNYKPAFEGQTRIKRITTTTAYKTDSIAGKLGRPWAIIALPSNNLLLTEKSGFMMELSAEGKLLRKISGFPKVNSEGQGGLLDVALDPDFTKNKTIYWSFAQAYGNNKDSANLTAVAKGQLKDGDTVIKNPKIIFRATPALKSTYHYGSRLLFDKDGYLFVSVGEKSILEGRKQAQWLNSGLGKLFRITKEGKAAPGNPFIGAKDVMPEIFSYGHRNPQSLDMNPVTGDIWEAEFGPMGGDELNLIKPGKNYGWPTITYGLEYSGKKIGDSIQQKEGFEQPVYYWDPVISPSGMIFYTGDAIPEWKNNLFISGLSSTNLVRLIIENNKIVGEERLLKDKKERIRDVTQLNGMLYLITDGGILFRISKS